MGYRSPLSPFRPRPFPYANRAIVPTGTGKVTRLRRLPSGVGAIADSRPKPTSIPSVGHFAAARPIHFGEGAQLRECPALERWFRWWVARRRINLLLGLDFLRSKLTRRPAPRELLLGLRARKLFHPGEATLA